mmetsp:Transcript_7320/g.13479  ORF Transcript_7320/g.13479 Transcript_7320/m.13479 type:complete len:243 (-) Transcript_7320:2-730(-)
MTVQESESFLSRFWKTASFMMDGNDKDPSASAETETEPKLFDTGLIDYEVFLEMHCNPISGIDQLKKLDPSFLSVLRKNHHMLLTVFRFLDKNHSGKIDRDEFRKGIQFLRRKRLMLDHDTKKTLEDREPSVSSSQHKDLNTGEIDAIFDAIDLDGNGVVDLEEFEKALQSIEMPPALAVFKLLDEDRNGVIDRNEFLSGIDLLNRHLRPHEKVGNPGALFDQIDTNGDGYIDVDELQKAFG